MRYRFAKSVVAAFLVVCLWVWFKSAGRPDLDDAIPDAILRWTQPPVAVTVSYLNLHGHWIRRFLVSNSSKYVSCEYVLFGYSIAITTGCHLPQDHSN